MRRSGFPFWRFSLRVYRAPRVAQACLALQDDCGADVNLLLYCCWLGLAGRQLSRRALRAALRAVAPWQREVVQPLRGARRALNKRNRNFDTEGAAHLRKRIGSAELDAEYVEQRVLAECASGLPRSTRKREPRAAAAANLKCYLQLLELRAGRLEANLAALLDACCPRATSAPGR